MPTYTVNYGQPATNSWMEGASALANALTPDYKGMADAKVKKAQAENYYAGAYADEQLARQRGAAAALDERELGVWKELDAKMADQGIPVEERQQLFVDQFLPRLGKVDGASAGDWALASGGLRGVDDTRMNQLQLGSGMAAGDTLRGEAADQQRQYWETGAELANDREIQRMADAAELERQYAEPIITGENEYAHFSPGHPMAPEGARRGPVIVGEGEKALLPQQEYLGPAGAGTTSNIFSGAPKPAKAPETIKVNEGLEEVTYQFVGVGHPKADPNGWLEIARGPRTSAMSGDVSMTPTDKVFSEDTAATLESALVAGRDAVPMLAQIERSMAMLQQNVPSGFWTNAAQPVRQALAGLGLADEKTVGQIEALTADLGNRVMARIQETKGAVSNAEMDYFRKISASIGQTPYGNLLLLEAERRVWIRAQQMRNYALSLKGLPPEQISEDLEEWRNSHPIWKPEELANIDLMAPNEALGSPTSAFDGIDTSAYTGDGSEWD